MLARHPSVARPKALNVMVISYPPWPPGLPGFILSIHPAQAVVQRGIHRRVLAAGRQPLDGNGSGCRHERQNVVRAISFSDRGPWVLIWINMPGGGGSLALRSSIESRGFTAGRAHRARLLKSIRVDPSVPFPDPRVLTRRPSRGSGLCSGRTDPAGRVPQSASAVASTGARSRRDPAVRPPPRGPGVTGCSRPRW